MVTGTDHGSWWKKDFSTREGIGVFLNITKGQNLAKKISAKT
jgi:hypothetical protein